MNPASHTLRRTAQAIAATAATLALAAPAALAATNGAQHNDPWSRYAISSTHQNTSDPWHAYALSLTSRTLAGTSPQHNDPWYRYALSYSTRTQASNHNGYRFITDTLGGNGQAAQPQGYRFIADTLGGNGLSSQPQGYRFTTDTLGGSGGTPIGTLASNGSGFDWGDAGIGAAGALGMTILLIGGSLLVLRKRSGIAI